MESIIIRKGNEKLRIIIQSLKQTSKGMEEFLVTLNDYETNETLIALHYAWINGRYRLIRSTGKNKKKWESVLSQLPI